MTASTVCLNNISVLLICIGSLSVCSLKNGRQQNSYVVTSNEEKQIVVRGPTEQMNYDCGHEPGDSLSTRGR